MALLNSFLQKWPLKGHLKASGPFHYECCSAGMSGSKFDALFNASFKDGEFKGFRFDDINQVTLSYNSEKGLTIRKIAAGLKSDQETGAKQIYN